MNKLTIQRQNGGVPKTLPGEDHISGLMFYGFDAYPSGFSAADQFKAISTIEKAEELGIEAENASWFIKMLHYQLSEIFRINPAISLYVGITTSVSSTFAELKALQVFANGKLRQIGVWAGSKAFAAADVTALQGIGTYFETKDTPCSIVYAPKITAIASLPNNVAVSGQKNVSVIIAQDGEGTANDLFTAAANTTPKNTVSAIGILLASISLASVHESISYVEKFPSGVSVPAFGDGTLFNTVDTAVIEGLDTAQYIFLRTYPGMAGSYFNDSWTLDLVTSDYCTIESVRTMDKAVRGITAYLTPKLGMPLKVDAETGKLDQQTVAYLEVVAGMATEDMEKKGELSGYKVEIDPEQNVLSSSEVEIVIKNVAVGVMRKVKVKIGYTTKLS